MRDNEGREKESGERERERFGLLSLITILIIAHSSPFFHTDGGTEKISTTKNYSTDAIASGEPSPLQNGILLHRNNVAA